MLRLMAHYYLAFGLMEENNDDKKIGKQLDRLVMGIILGGAIGSVLGLTLAPRKGKETRELIKNKGEKFIQDHRETIQGAAYQIKKGKGFLHWLFRRRASSQKMPKSSMNIHDDKES